MRQGGFRTVRRLVARFVDILRGGRIPRYAGNLDIVNAAAVHVAERSAAASPAGMGTETS
ncbi:hypothetical protein GCM10010295_13010 [Streptomyces intermedius]